MGRTWIVLITCAGAAFAPTSGAAQPAEPPAEDTQPTQEAADTATEPAPPEPAPPAPVPEPPPPAATTITAYGVMVFDGYYNTGAVTNADVPLYASTPASGNEASIGATARQSRFGIKAASPAAAAALKVDSVEGVFEIDFFGGYYPTNNNSWVNQLLPRLRLYNVAVSTKTLKIVVGQDWMIFAPANPDSIHHMELPALSNTGNLWSRLPQARAEIKLGTITAVAGVLGPADSTAVNPMVPVTPLRDPSAADRSLVPSLQARVAYVSKLATVGISGHFGRERTLDAMMENVDLSSYGAALDATVTVGALTIKGEAFIGANLDPFFSGAAIVGTEPTPVHGYWAQVGYKLGKLGVFLAYGSENPKDPSDSVMLPSPAISLNRAFNGAVTWTFAPKFVVGVEVDYIDTKRIGIATEQAEAHAAITAQYGF